MSAPRHNLQRGYGLLVALLLVACGLTRPGPAVRYYALSLPMPPAPPPAGDRPALSLRRFTARGPFGQEQMVYHPSPYRIDYYSYHRWSGAPPSLVADWTQRYLRASGLFSRVSEFPGDLILSAVINQFEEVDRPGVWTADLSVDFIVTRASDAAVLWVRTYEASQPAARRNPEAIAEAMSRNLLRVLAQLTADLQPIARAARPAAHSAHSAPSVLAAWCQITRTQAAMDKGPGRAYHVGESRPPEDP